MAHIALKNEKLPGISGLLYNRPDTAKPLSDLAQTLLRGESSTLTSGERELIAASVSSMNQCNFCFHAHGSAAAALLGRDLDLLDEIEGGMKDLSPKMQALLNIAGKVQQSGREVVEADVQRAKEAGATDDDIHDTVLIAAAFCMFNRYVDGLGTWSPTEKEAYRATGQQLANDGYLMHKMEESSNA